MTHVRPVNILLVEDSEDDILLTRSVLEEARVANDLDVVRDGVEALDYLRRRGEFADKARPDVILLDLNLPRMDGREVLEEIKGDPELRTLPVVVLTTSQAEQDILAAYERQVNAYITKPIQFDDFVATLRSFEDFWLSIVKLPRGDSA